MRNQNYPGGFMDRINHNPSFSIDRETRNTPEPLEGNMDPVTLHQGQGPDFNSQNSEVQKKNQGVKDIKKETIGFKQSVKDQEEKKEKERKQKNDINNPDPTPGDPEKDPTELPSRHPEEKPYIGDNPEETREESPKM